MHCSSHVCSALIVGEAREDENLDDLATKECYGHGPLAVPAAPGPALGQSFAAVDLGGAARARAADCLVSGMHSQRPRGTWSTGAAATHAASLRAGDAGIAVRLTDLAVAAAFAGGLGVGGELDGFVARAAALLGGEADGLGLDCTLLVAQVLADGVAEAPGSSRWTATSQDINESNTTRVT